MEKILILYHENSEAWSQRLQTQLGVLQLRFPFQVFAHDRDHPDLADLTANAWVVVLLLSKPFFTPFKQQETEARLAQRQATGRPTYLIQVDDFALSDSEPLKSLPVWPVEGVMDRLAESRAEAVLADLTDTVAGNFQPKGLLSRLLLENLGPGDRLLLEPAARFNLITPGICRTSATSAGYGFERRR